MAPKDPIFSWTIQKGWAPSCLPCLIDCKSTLLYPLMSIHPADLWAVPAGLNVQSVISNRRLVVRLLDKRLDEQQLLRKSRFLSVRVHQTARHQLLAPPALERRDSCEIQLWHDFCLFQQLLQDSNQAVLGRRGVIRDMRNVRASINAYETYFPYLLWFLTSWNQD